MTVGNVSAVAAPMPLYVTKLASARADWASTRQAAIAGNIANANTPRYKARDIAAFKAELSGSRLQLAANNPRHMVISDLEARAQDVDPARSWDVKHSANTVSLDAELMKADQTARTHQLALSVMGAFHRMALTSVSFR